MPRPLSVGDLAELTGEPEARVRRAVDKAIDKVVRIGGYRVIDQSQVPQVLAELDRVRALVESRTLRQGASQDVPTLLNEIASRRGRLLESDQAEQQTEANRLVESGQQKQQTEVRQA